MTLTEEDRLHLRIADDMRDLTGGDLGAYIASHIQRLIDGAMSEVLFGLDADKYRQKIGYIAALNEVLNLPGELYAAETNAKKKLND